MGTMEEKIYERQVTKLAISKRVIDEQQIDRHYKAKDLNELYMTNLDVDDERPPAALPKDLLFAELLRKFDKLIYKYHEQDSLLENKEEETLSKAEIEAAWEEYEQEKTRKPIVQMNSIPVQYPRGLYTIQSTIHFHAINGIHLSHFYLTFRWTEATSGSIYGIPSEIMVQLLGIIYKTGNPGATYNTINQNVPGLLSYLYESMGKGDTTVTIPLILLHFFARFKRRNNRFLFNKQFYDSLMRLYHSMVPNAHLNPGVSHPGMMNGIMPNGGMMSGGTSYPVQRAPPTQSFMQQPIPNAVNMNADGVIDIDSSWMGSME